MKKRILSFILAVILAAAMLPLSGSGAEGSASVSVETRAGQSETIEVVETASTDAEGTTTERTAEGYVAPSGMIVDYSGKNVEQVNGLYKFEDHYTSQDANDTYEAEGGSDKSNEYHAPASEIGIRIGEDDVGKSNTVSGEPVKVIETTGDVKENDADGIYDYTVKERITQSVIKVTTKSLSITDSHGAVNPDDMEYVHSDMKPDYSLLIDDDLDLVTIKTSNEVISQLEIPPADDVVALITGDYQYVNLESDQVAAYWPGWLFSSPQSASDTPVYEDEAYKLYGVYNYNHLRRKTFYLPDHRIVNVADDDHPNGIGIRWDNVWFYTLADKHKNVITAYCADQRTSSEELALYRIYNLEDAEYYEEEQAKHIRAIGNKGYWGLEGGESDFGTLDAVKKLMRDSGQFTDEQIEALTPGMAMCATQMAIWSYSNVIKDDMTFVNVHHVLKNGSITPASYHAAEEPDPDKAELIMRLYWLLHDLEPEAISEDDATTENTIINEKSFLKSVNLTITDKPADHANNKDADKTNDVYTVDLEIAFKVKPLEENGDDLVLEIQDQNGDTIVKARIAGPIREGEVPASVVEDGIYKIEGIQLQEGETALKFALSGTQNLRNDVYFFSSEDEDGTIVSQPMVGVARGKRDVNIWMDLTFELDVTDEELKEEHFWRTEQTYIEIPVEKDWQDADNQDGVRPEKIVVRLYADGTEVKHAEVTPDENGDWKYTFTELPKYTEDGTAEIVYTVAEDPVPEYEAPEYSETEDGTIKIVNRHTPKTTTVDGKKTWDDDYDRDEMRPTSITIRLLADGVEVASKKVTKADGWKWSFTDLPKYKNGKEIAYTIKEDRVLGYTATVKGYDVINTYSPPTGDSDNPAIWIALAVLSVLAAGALVVLERLYRKRTQN